MLLIYLLLLFTLLPISLTHAQDTIILEQNVIEKVFTDHSFKVFLSKNDGSLFVRINSDKSAIVYHAEPGENDGTTHSAIWQRGTWSVRGSELCLNTHKSMCGNVGINVHYGGRVKTPFWVLDDQIKHEIYDYNEEDQMGLSDPNVFFDVSHHYLTSSTVYIWPEIDELYDSYDKPLGRSSQVLVGEVQGFREAIQYERSAGYLVKIVGSATFSTRLLPEGEMELSISESTDCLQELKKEICSNDHFVIPEKRIIKTTVVEKMVSRVDKTIPAAQKLPTVLKSLGLKSLDGFMLAETAFNRGNKRVFDSSRFADDDYTDIAAPTLSLRALFEKSTLGFYFSNHTLGLGYSPNGAEVFYFFKNDGTLFSYRPDQIGPEPPRRGDLIVGKWQTKSGTVCLDFTLQSVCYERKKDAYGDQYNLIEVDGLNQYKVTNYVKGDALGVEDSIEFYGAYHPHELIGKNVYLFPERASRFYNSLDARLNHGSEFLEAEVLGYRDTQDDYNPEGFLVKIVGSHRLDVVQSGNQFRAEIIPLVGCLNQMCVGDVQLALSPRLIHQKDFTAVLDKIYNQIEDETARWDTLAKAVGIGVAVVATGVVIYKFTQSRKQETPEQDDLETNNDADQSQETPEEKIKRLEEELAKLRHEQRNTDDQEKADPNQKLLSAPANDNDPYSVLGVRKTASKAEIRKAYLKRVKQYHPDLYQQKSESEKKFAENQLKRINAAYEALIKQ